MGTEPGGAFPGTVPRCRGVNPPVGTRAGCWVPKLPKINYLLVPDLAATVVLEMDN